MAEIGKRALTGMIGLALAGIVPADCGTSDGAVVPDPPVLAARGRPRPNQRAFGRAGLNGRGLQRPPCTGSSPASSIIADFSDAFATRPGSFVFSTGGTFTYASAHLTPPALSLLSTDGTAAGQKLAVSINTGTPPADTPFAWDGFGLYFNKCTDASSYSGIRFTIIGDVGACPIQFAAQFSEDDDVVADSAFGSCTAASCFSPMVQPVGAGTTTVHFAELAGGSPMSTVDAARLTGVHWQVMPPTGVSAAACTANFTVDDVSFIP